MFKQKIIEQLSSQVENLFKNNPLSDVESNLKAILTATFDKMDLISREEFDIQQRVLAETRKKLDELESVIKKLEGK